MKRIWRKRLLQGSLAMAVAVAVGAWVALTLIFVRPATSEAQGYDGSRDALAQHLLRKRTDVAGLRGSLSSVHDL